MHSNRRNVTMQITHDTMERLGLGTYASAKKYTPKYHSNEHTITVVRNISVSGITGIRIKNMLKETLNDNESTYK